MKEYGADVVIIGSGITGALTAQWLSERSDASILLLEAGREIPVRERFSHRQRYLDYGEWPWPGTEIGNLIQEGKEAWPPHMLVGGMATHWGAQSPRYRPECFQLKTLYGVSEDWPITYEDLEPWYCEAEYRIGVSGDSLARDSGPRSRPYPMPAMPLNYNLARIQSWAASAGVQTFPRPFAINSVPYDGRPQCQRFDTCRVCPIDAKYSPDFTVRQLVQKKKIELIQHLMVNRLETTPSGDRIVRAHAIEALEPHSPATISGKIFVLAGGTVWAPYLLLLSANEKFPEGLANRSGMVGRYIVGHHPYLQTFRIKPKLVPEIHLRAALTSEQFIAPSGKKPLVRWDLALSAGSPGPQLAGEFLGAKILRDWRKRTQHGTVNALSFREAIGHSESRVTLSQHRTTAWGDPVPAVNLLDHGLVGGDAVDRSLFEMGERLANAGLGRASEPLATRTFDHRSGGCRMGRDPNTSVCDTTGRCHDHENLFIAGSPLCLTGGVTNSTLTFSALALRTAEAIRKQM